MYDAVDGLILKCGGSPSSEPATKATALFDPNGSDWWEAGPDMNFARRNHDLVVLPDQTILAVGGNLKGNGWNPGDDPVMEAEIFDPNATTPAWVRTFEDMTDPRWYHSTALLLPDARVLVAGGNLRAGYTEHSAQIFRPPYLDGDPERPDFDPSDPPPGEIEYNQSFQFKYTHERSGASIDKVALIRPASVTHSLDMDQRYVPLDFQEGTDGAMTAVAPANGFIAPPGYYMLFLVDDEGVPCKMARFIRVKPA
jgi:hypothetical protein